MCHERYWRRLEEAEDSRRIWTDFERAGSGDRDEPAPAAPEEPPTEVREEIEASLTR